VAPDRPLPANPSVVAPVRPAPDTSLLADPSAANPIRQRPAPDPSLLADPNAVGPVRPRPPPDPSLLADPSAANPARHRPPPDTSLLANPSAAGPARLRTAPRPSRMVDSDLERPASQTITTSLATGNRCRGVGGADPFCYEMRDAYADIGDPPLVGAYRNLSNVVLRFNTLLIAYADGISGRLLERDLDVLSASVTELSQIAPIMSISGVGAFTAGFSGVVTGLKPIAGIAGRITDRVQLRDFLLQNYAVVDEAIALLAMNSVELYANVAVGTNLYRRMSAPGADQALVTRRKEIRRLIANWTVLLDDTRRLLRELKAAIEVPDGLETQLRNLDSAVKARVDTSVMKREIATLGTPALAP